VIKVAFAFWSADDVGVVRLAIYGQHLTELPRIAANC